MTWACCAPTTCVRVLSFSLVSMLLVIRPVPGCRCPCKSCLSSSDESSVGPTLVPTIHKLALHLIEMEGLIHQPGQSLKFSWLQDRGYIPALFPFSMEILLSGPAASCVFMRHRQPQAATGPTAVALFSMLGLGRRKPAVRPRVLEEARLVGSADARLLQACWAPSAASLPPLPCTCGSNRTPQAAQPASPLPCTHW